MKLLLVEDDESLAGAVGQLLADHHYPADLATDGETGRQMAEAFSYDLVLLDWMLPKLNGMQLCKQLRAAGNHTPIILMTARDARTEQVAGLDAGADDYLVKPFEFAELLERIRALLHRAQRISSPVLQWGGLRLDTDSCGVTYCGFLLALTPKEQALLTLFSRNPHRIFSLNNLLESVWRFEDLPHVGAVRPYIKALRQKLRRAGVPEVIETVYGLGYRLKPAETADLSASLVRLEAEAAETELAKAGGVSINQNLMPPDLASLDLTPLWQTVRENYTQRVAAIVSTLRPLQTGPLDPTMRQFITTEVHALAGSLGSFGFQSVTTLCREVEDILRANADLSSRQVYRLQLSMARIQQTLTQTTPETIPAPPPNTGSLPLSQQLLLVVRQANSSSWVEALTADATGHGVQVSAVDDIACALAAIATTPPDIVLLELSDTEPPTFGTAHNGTAHDGTAHNSTEKLLADLQKIRPSLPVLVLSKQISFETRVKVARLGAAGLLQAPATPAEVIDVAMRVLQKGAPPAAKLLVVDDDPAILKLIEQLLLPWGFRLQLLDNPQHFWEILEQFTPDLVILDVEMPQLSGLDLCQVMRNAPAWSEVPVLFLSAYTGSEMIQKVFSAGADDYMRKPVLAPELVARVLSWLERARIRRLRADIDSLTGVANRRKSTQDLTRLLGLARRQGQLLCLALIDLDYFKRVNDEYGHAVGDRVLRHFGEQLRATFRGEDVVARWGGEEFVVGLYGIGYEESTQRLTQFLHDWQQERFTGNDQPGQSNRSFRTTFSAGIAVYPDHAADLQGLYRTADKALYRAKVAGRNQVL